MSISQNELSQDDKGKRKALVAELDKNLNLSVNPKHTETSNVLLDLLRLQFVDLIRDLDALANCYDLAEKKQLSMRVRSWLTSLNNIPYLPLFFRLKHLRQLEGYLDVLASDMGGLILCSYKLGILHLKDKSADSPMYLREIVSVAATALDLAGRQLSQDCMKHISHSIVEVRQSLDIARLALLVAATLPEACDQEVACLKKFVIRYELIRRIDFYACTKEQKDIMLRRILQYAALADVSFLRSGEQISGLGKGPFLVSQISKPHRKPRRMTCLPERLAYDALVLSLAGLLRRVLLDMDMVREVEEVAKKGYAMCLERDVSAAKVCSDVLRSMFRKVKREKRISIGQKEVSVGVHVGLVMQWDDKYSRNKAEEGWVLHNLSHAGAMLQCEICHGRVVPVGALLSFQWPVKKGWPKYGIVRHVQVSSQGYERLGVEFVLSDLKPAILKLVHAYNGSIQSKAWPALLEQYDGGWRVWLGSTEHYHSPLTVSIESKGKGVSHICRIYPTGNFAYNYSCFKISEVLTMSELRAMALAHAEEDEKKSLDQLDF